MKFKDLNLEYMGNSISTIKIGDVDVQVKQYLSIEEKSNLVTFVTNGAMDDETGIIDPIRTEVYFALGVCDWYTDIDFDYFSNDFNIVEIYDLLETNGVINLILSEIPKQELQFLEEAVKDTMETLGRYNFSAVGIIKGMNNNAGNLNEQLNEIIKRMQSEEGQETFKAFADMVKSD